jgi:hypothetical protein
MVNTVQSRVGFPFGHPGNAARDDSKRSRRLCRQRVAQRGTLLYRRLAAGGGVREEGSLPSCDTAGCQPALRSTAINP